jgi:hypothetical protein
MRSASLTETILQSIENISEDCRIRSREGYTAGYARLKISYYEKVLEKIKQVIGPVIKNGEKIENQIADGEIVDSGIKQFEVKRGVFLEVYDYKKTTAIFIRLYHIKGDKEWLALYIDENPETPWWEK